MVNKGYLRLISRDNAKENNMSHVLYQLTSQFLSELIDRSNQVIIDRCNFCTGAFMFKSNEEQCQYFSGFYVCTEFKLRKSTGNAQSNIYLIFAPYIRRA
jgi:hypothetical protein